MTTSLLPPASSPTAHLEAHRRLILGRALLAGAAGLVPLPWIDDVLAGQVRAGLVRRVADLRRVDVDNNAVAELTAPRGSRLLGAAGMGAAVLGGARRVWRHVAASIVVVRRADEAVQTFQIGTLFDHYCARHHLGLGLDGDRARRLRIAMDEAVRVARGEALERSFAVTLRRARALAAWIRRRDEGDDVPEVIAQLEAELEGPAGVYVASLVGAFDVAWAPHKQAQLEGPK